jgi:hypothetical protein
MLFYSQGKGVWTNEAGEVLVSGCYAGIGSGKNNPDMQTVHNVGPLPQGVYGIGPLMIHPPGDPLRHLGPCMSLTPHPTNTMFGRSGFFIHLDNPAHPGMSSNGCIVPQGDGNMSGLGKLQKIDYLREKGEAVVTVTA